MHIRYNTTTLLEVYRSTVPYTTLPDTGFADAEVPDANVSGPVGQCRIAADLSAVAVDPTLAPTPLPDWVGFLKWIATTFDPPTVNRFASGYPEFNGYCQFGNATGAQWCIINGKTKLATDGLPVMSATNYALFQGANVTYHLGMVLP